MTVYLSDVTVPPPYPKNVSFQFRMQKGSPSEYFGLFGSSAAEVLAGPNCCLQDILAGPAEQEIPEKPGTFPSPDLLIGPWHQFTFKNYLSDPLLAVDMTLEFNLGRIQFAAPFPRPGSQHAGLTVTRLAPNRVALHIEGPAGAPLPTGEGGIFSIPIRGITGESPYAHVQVLELAITTPQGRQVLIGQRPDPFQFLAGLLAAALSPTVSKESSELSLSVAYPNPLVLGTFGGFAPFGHEAGTQFQVSIPPSAVEGAPATLEIWNLKGQRVAISFQGILPPGKHILTWDGRTAQGQSAESGLYYAILNAGGKTLRRPLTVIRP